MRLDREGGIEQEIVSNVHNLWNIISRLLSDKATAARPPVWMDEMINVEVAAGRGERGCSDNSPANE
jgi:hypothetical protein